MIFKEFVCKKCGSVFNGIERNGVRPDCPSCGGEAEVSLSGECLGLKRGAESGACEKGGGHCCGGGSCCCGH